MESLTFLLSTADRVMQFWESVFQLKFFFFFWPQRFEALGMFAKILAALSHSCAKQTNIMTWKMYKGIIGWEVIQPVTHVAVNESRESDVSLDDAKSQINLNKKPTNGQLAEVWKLLYSTVNNSSFVKRHTVGVTTIVFRMTVRVRVKGKLKKYSLNSCRTFHL